jgi:hypothetical protein
MYSFFFVVFNFCLLLGQPFLKKKKKKKKKKNLFLGALFHLEEIVSAYDLTFSFFLFLFFFLNKFVFGALFHWKKPFQLMIRLFLFFFVLRKTCIWGPYFTWRP